LISDEEVKLHTELWIKKVVIDCHFCPFAAAPVKNNVVRYTVERNTNLEFILNTLLNECTILDNDAAIETTFIILPDSFPDFRKYLDFVELAENLLRNTNYDGVYQLASFHPEYLFAGSNNEDAANYTNRSIFPMLHLLREAAIDEALEHYKEPESIPERNIEFARKKGLVYMKMLRDSIAGK
jgi:hypothetical protein